MNKTLIFVGILATMAGVINNYAAADMIKNDIAAVGDSNYFIEKVGMRMAEEGINVKGIPTSFQSLLLAKKWNIPITSLEENDIDLSVDGADEVDGKFNLIKGGGAAHTKEKIVDYVINDGIMHSLDMYTEAKEEFLNSYRKKE